ncbi:MAG TPA: hypothetical protein DCX32_04385 [Candidatus Moranbacteria bacterium]|nr:MAG: hypothetical protein UW87_C0002G0013 [Candidatus Moranbacteria bacterium GW2011_GWC2_45_10]KKT95184.1 MAG: hypothetical protein UW95_C0003G0026 [Parcubacteria group bacterium GW2011_GWC1_45_14]HAV11745.1 hypothetical protein [Candidatus Moranbacteria bacterium]
MALEGTHIKFALAVKDKLGIKDMRQYLSGTIYPDSRYIAKTARNLTHAKEFLEKGFAADDFKKGWQVHLFCDEIQKDLAAKLINPLGKEISQYDDLWISLTAVKILQEMRDLEGFQIRKYLKYLKAGDLPNGEDISDMERYYGFVRKFYDREEAPALDDYEKLWDFFGIPARMGREVTLRCEKFQKDPAMAEKISDIHQESVRIFKNNH